MADIENKAFGWDDEITYDGSDFVLLSEGDYPFFVQTVEKGYHEGSANLPPCPKAVLSVIVDGGDAGTVTIKHNLFLHSKSEWSLSAFFRALGLKKHGEPVRLSAFERCTGIPGRCHVGVRTWTGRDGNERKSNEITRFYDPDDAQAAPVMPSPSTGSRF